MTDAGPIAAIAGLLPAPYSTWFAWVVGLAAIASFLCSAFTAAVKPPPATAPSWLALAYRVVSWGALNLLWARNAVIPGMPVEVQNAAKVAAQLAAAAPHLTTVAVEPGVVGVIATKAP